MGDPPIDNMPYVAIPCEVCGAPIGEPCRPGCKPCIRDDSTECDCSRCRADDVRWEQWQGWDVDYPYEADEGVDDG